MVFRPDNLAAGAWKSRWVYRFRWREARPSVGVRSACSGASANPLRKLGDRVAVAPRKAAFGCFLPGEPLPGTVLGGGGCNVDGLRQAQAENVLDILGDARGIAMPPFGEYLVGVAQAPIGKVVEWKR